MNVFKDFYFTLYVMYIKGIIFPKIGNDQVRNLEQPWNISEITKSINGKSAKWKDTWARLLFIRNVQTNYHNLIE